MNDREIPWYKTYNICTYSDQWKYVSGSSKFRERLLCRNHILALIFVDLGSQVVWRRLWHRYYRIICANVGKKPARTIEIFHHRLFTACLQPAAADFHYWQQYLSSTRPYVQRVDKAFHWINLYPVEKNAIDSPNSYPLNSYLPGGKLKCYGQAWNICKYFWAHEQFLFFRQAIAANCLKENFPFQQEVSFFG